MALDSGTGTVTAAADQAGASGAAPVVPAAVDDTTAQGAITPPGAAEAAAQGVETADDDREAGEEEVEALLSEEEATALAGNPKALMKALNRSYTQKMQALGEGRRFLEALRENPREMVKELARRTGMTVQEAAAVASAPQSPFRDALVAEFGEDAAARMLPAFEQAVDAKVSGHLQELKATQETLLAQASVERSKATMEAFTAKYPDWRKYEKTMTEIGRTLQSAPGAMTEMQYLETLRTLAMARNPAAMARELTDRMNAAARNAERPGTGTPPSRIGTAPPANATTRDAVEAAFKGIDWSKGQ